MKNLTKKQVQEVKALTRWSNTNFHGNTKKVGSLLLSDYLTIIGKKRKRAFVKSGKETDVELIKRLIQLNKQYIGTSYVKIIIEGNTGLYLASPSYKHSDYNKTRLFDKSEKTLKLMRIYNAIINI